MTHASSRRGVTVVAHRGDSLRHRENTLPAFASAVDGGADRVELDVRTSRDGQCVVLHDRSVLRLWGVAARADALEYDDMATLGYADVRVPRLTDVFDLLAGGGVGVLIDVVRPRDARVAVETVAAYRESHPDMPDVHWCGTVEPLRVVRRMDPDAVLYLPTDDGYADLRLVSELRPRFLNMPAILLAGPIADTAHGLGLAVSAWTVDDPEQMAALAGLLRPGDSITTNRPRLLRQVLDEGQIRNPLVPGPPDPWAAELALATELGQWAASYLREVRPSEIAVKEHDADVLTDVDVTIERRVRAAIAADFPAHLVIGEEEGAGAAGDASLIAPDPNRPTWWLDPLDGTMNYAHDLGWSSFSLGLELDGSVRLGVVADAARDQVFTASAGLGAWMRGRKMRASTAQRAAGGIAMLEWTHHEPWPGQIELMAALAADGVTTRVMGSGALALTMVAAGRAVAAMVGTFNPIDHAAGYLLAVEAGAVACQGDLLDTAGGAMTPRAGVPLLMAAPGCADQLVGLWRSTIRV